MHTKAVAKRTPHCHAGLSVTGEATATVYNPFIAVRPMFSTNATLPRAVLPVPGTAAATQAIRRGEHGKMMIAVYIGGDLAASDVIITGTHHCNLTGSDAVVPAEFNSSASARLFYNCSSLPVGTTTAVFSAAKGGE